MEKKPKTPNSKKNPLKNYAKYSSVVFQAVAIILVGVYAGVKLDEYAAFSFPLFKLIFSLLSTAGAMYYLVKQLSKK